MKEQWKQQMRQKMADYREPAPEVSWDEIEKALAANKQKAKTVTMWPRRIAAAVVVLVTAGAGYYLLNREQQEIIEETAETQLIEGTIIQEPVIPQKEEVSDLPILAKAKHKIQQAIEEKKMETLSALAVVEDSVEQLAQIVEEQSEVQAPESQEVKTQAPEPQGLPQAQPRKSSLPEAHPTIYPFDFKRSVSSGKRLMAKVYLSNVMSGNYVSTDLLYYNPNKGYSGNDNIIDYPVGENITSETDTTTVQCRGSYPDKLTSRSSDGNNQEPVNENVHHHQPIRFGLLLRYAFNERWSIESGLSYALLTSDISLSSTSFKAEAEQRLTYIGIPVNVNYQLWSNRYFSVYASVGGMAEKMVKGKRHVEVTLPSRQEGEESVSIRPLQFSVNGGVGAEFKFVDWLSLYAEPGVGYWFDNGSDVPTYYQDKPFSFNLIVGLRFTIK